MVVTSGSLFEENFKLLSQFHPQLALQLERPQALPLLSPSLPPLFFCETLEKKTELLYLFGVGTGEALEAAEEWLRQKRTRSLVFLEDSSEAISQFLTTERAKKLLQNSKISLHLFSDPTQDEGLFPILAWDAALKSLEVKASDNYAKQKTARFEALRQRLLYEHALKKEIAQEYRAYGATYYQNFYANMRLLPSCFLGNALFGKFKNTPAIICGAGPSLSHYFRDFPSLRHRALIFAGGSALTALSAHQLAPHFGCGIDPNPTQLKRLLKATPPSLPFFFRGRLYSQATAAIQGPRLYVTGSGGYETAGYFEEKLGISPPVEIDEGQNVVNFCVSLAHLLGCSPLIFIGLDLAYTANQSYTEGVILNAALSQNQKKNAIVQADIYGNPVLTEWKWLDEASWIGNFAAEHPEVSLFNATGQGIGLPGVSNISSDELSALLSAEPQDFDKKIQVALKNARLPKSSAKKVAEAFQDLYKSLVVCGRYLEVALQQLQNRTFSEGHAALLEVELEEQEAYRCVLHVFDLFIQRMQYPEEKILQRSALSETRRAQKKRLLQRKRFAFLQKVVKSQLLILQTILSHENPRFVSPSSLEAPT